jgi:hypothetical protein
VAVPQLGALQQVVDLGPRKQTADILHGAGLVIDALIEIIPHEGLTVDRFEQPIEVDIHVSSPPGEADPF